MRRPTGDRPGTDTAEQIFAGLLKGGPTSPGTYYEALVADDDDGDLAERHPEPVPTSCEAFGRHGLERLTAAVGPHDPRAADRSSGRRPTPGRGRARCRSPPACARPRADRRGGPLPGRRRRLAAGRRPRSAGDRRDRRRSRPRPLGTFVEYYIDGAGHRRRRLRSAPAAGEFAPYTFYVGRRDRDRAATTSRPTTAASPTRSSTARTSDGADDWEWGAPTGLAGDPAAAFSGDERLGQRPRGRRTPTARTSRTRYTADQPEDRHRTVHRRVPPVPPVAAGRGRVVRPGGDHRERRAGLVEPRQRHRAAPSTTSDEQWVSPRGRSRRASPTRATVELGFGAPRPTRARVRRLDVDDVCLYAPATPDNRLAIVDFVAEDQGGPIGLSWTNPRPRPGRGGRRPADRPPTRPATTTATSSRPSASPELGAAVAEVHDNIDGSSGYYAVYASDGTDWLSWTIDGLERGPRRPERRGPDRAHRHRRAGRHRRARRHRQSGGRRGPGGRGGQGRRLWVRTSGPAGSWAFWPLLMVFWRRFGRRLG